MNTNSSYVGSSSGTPESHAEAAHTPGPWRYVVIGGDRHIFAGPDSLMGETNCSQWVSANEADWPLIAAAPALLAFAQGVENLFAEAHQRGLHLDEDKVCLRREARAVIAKATGKA